MTSYSYLTKLHNNANIQNFIIVTMESLNHQVYNKLGTKGKMLDHNTLERKNEISISGCLKHVSFILHQNQTTIDITYCYPNSIHMYSESLTQHLEKVRKVYVHV